MASEGRRRELRRVARTLPVVRREALSGKSSPCSEISASWIASSFSSSRLLRREGSRRERCVLMLTRLLASLSRFEGVQGRPKSLLWKGGGQNASVQKPWKRALPAPCVSPGRSRPTKSCAGSIPHQSLAPFAILLIRASISRARGFAASLRACPFCT